MSESRESLLAGQVCNCPRDGDMRRTGVRIEPLDPCPVHTTAGPAGSLLADQESALALLRETLMTYVPDGFRDDYGGWHDGPHRRDALAALDAVERENKTLRNEVERLRTGSEIPALREMVAAQAETIARLDVWFNAVRDAQTIIANYSDGRLDPLVALGKIGNRLLAVPK